MHVINEDYETHSKHNFNIDEFNVHTRDLGYFETQTISFLADKKGTFEYYCTIHPEMRGTIEIIWEFVCFASVKLRTAKLSTWLYFEIASFLDLFVIVID